MSEREMAVLLDCDASKMSLGMPTLHAMMFDPFNW